ncbi:unnamed protein product [Adineta steineri]|uniref:Cyclin-dependent kinases regulatory subunit n=1 Tax=Adineta steineri TaxID=433720 RepID=A0A813V4P9_9BILA|nr:unnamed protein product [Adineta steineri]CAF0832339.1 unnamed protein product [Adineta steineri]CAF3960633.1 unnamed protein product [Adineta steineri]CAF3974623.1 unnamed protein product [Adineta steineri]
MPPGQQQKPPRYSSTYEDDKFQYRHVILDKEMVPVIPKNRLMDEVEWRALGIKQGPHWEHYLIHKPEPFVLMFRRQLKYRVEPDPGMQQQNTHFPTTRMPVSATMNMSTSYPLGDSTNTKKTMVTRGGSSSGGLRVAVNPYKVIHDQIDEEDNELLESGFVSHCDE